ncbi:MAG: carbohydrate binding domain-containing protein [Candidatus Hydrogenedentes bacterium]|nr:carbohydrate binding domain-containing protein [Candidatus Hydrogenedentota bacterium]
MMKAFVAAMLLVSGAATAQEWEAPNLVTNPGFEEAGASTVPEGWHGDAAVFSRDVTVKRSGEASLKYVNSDGNRYVLCGQSIPIQPGTRYVFSAWVKSDGVEGEDVGATLCLEYRNAEGSWAGGTYASEGARGTVDWTRVEMVTARIPEGVAGGTITCYLRKGMAGTAWWDDVEVKQFRGDPLSLVLLSPNYRNEITDAGPETVRILADTAELVDYELAADDVELSCLVLPESGPSAVTPAVQAVSGTMQTTVELPGKILAPGPYTVEVRLVQKSGGRALSTKSCRILRTTHAPDRTAYIDQHNRLIYQGQPFFPLGMYWGDVTDEQLDVFADGPFNCLMPYAMIDKAKMDAVHQHGLKVVYSVKDCYVFLPGHPGEITSEDTERAFIAGKVEAFREHPALLAWYLNDEAPLKQHARLVAHREWLEELDPNHATWSVLYQIGEIGGYIDTCHAIGTDPYPIPEHSPAAAGEWTRKTVAAMHGVRPVWMVPQVFNWGAYKESDADRYRQPTIDEVRSMTWQCIAEGAQGLIFYSWFNLYLPQRNAGLDFAAYWPQFKEVVQEVKDVVPALLSIETPPAITVPQADWLNWTVKRLGGTVYLFAVNNSYDAHEAAFTLPSAPTNVKRVGTEQEMPFSAGNVLPLTFAPLEVWRVEMTGL